MIRTVFRIASALALTIGALAASAQVAQPDAAISSAPVAPVNSPSTELLHNSTVRLLQSDYDTQLLRLPPDTRGGFGTDIDRVNALLRVILVDKTLAAEARKQGVDSDPQVQAIIAAETERILSKAMMDRDEIKWGKEFDARPNMEQAARERWLTQPGKSRRPVEIEVTHILYAVPKHTAAEAMALAQAARAKVAAGADMQALARAESDDPSAKDNGGDIGWHSPDQLDPRFARAAMALKNPGDLSPPVQSNFGYHVIRLDARRGGETRPFAEAKDQIIAELRNKYIEEKRTERLAAIRNDPTIVVNQPAVDKLVVRIDPALLRKLQQNPGGVPK